MKKILTLLFITTVIAFAPVIILLDSYKVRLQTLAGDFARSIFDEVTTINIFDLKYNSYYIAGTIGDSIYLANYTVQPQLLKITTSLSDTQTIRIKYINIDPPNSHYEIMVCGKYFYILYGTEKLILRGTTDTWIASKLDIFTPYFEESTVISKDCIAFRYVSAKNNENTLGKTCTDARLIENMNILEKQVDGRYCTSGILEFNQNLGWLTYLYSFRNQILVMDTNLNLLRKIKTIDDIDTARFSVSIIKSNGKRVITDPTIMVNPKCANYKNYLFVHSKIMGKHEDDRKFEHSTAIDIYDIKKGNYVYSFYLPNINKKNISQLAVIDEYVYTISETYLTRYKVKLPE